MNILLSFATNSGGTQSASEVASQILKQKGHTVTMKEIKDTTFEEFANYPLVILATPSWDFDGNEGMPHEYFVNFINQNKGKMAQGKQFAVLGLGDSTYTHFCGGADHLEQFVRDIQGTLVSDSLRVDGYYNDMGKANQQVTEWAEKLASKITG